MDITFKCSNCEQELEVDASGAGSEIECPSCSTVITVPFPEPALVVVGEDGAVSAPVPEPAKDEKHFTVPVHEHTSEKLIQKPRSKPLDVVATVKIKTFKHGDCVEGAKDNFDDTVSTFLETIGNTSIISVSTISYTAANASLDYGVVIVYKA